jgi:hypothetical protein
MVCIVLVAACSRETAAPPERSTAAATALPPAASTTIPAPQTRAASYDDAMSWFRSTPAFRFTIDEAGVHAEGEMKRETVGAESATFRVEGEEWRAASGTRGVTWERRNGNTWSAAEAPAWGTRLYQRITVAFDPQKKEGTAQAVEPGHFRFTNANNGEVHDVWVREGRIERMRIGDSLEMTITP